MAQVDGENRPRVLLFTETFPGLAHLEPFISVEIEELAHRVDLVLIPTVRTTGPLSDVPDGVQCEMGMASFMGARLPQFWGLLRALLHRGTYREIGAFRARALNPRLVAAVIVRASRMLRAQAWTDRFLGGTGTVVAYSWWSSAAGYGVARAAKAHSVACIARIHGYELYPEQDRLGRIPFQGSGLAAFDGVYSVSQAGADFLKSQQPSLAPRIHVAYLGVVAPLAPGRPSTDGVFRILSCSACIPIKRVELLASAIACLARDYPDIDFSWTHIGAGPTRTTVQLIVDAQPGLADRCAFTGLLPPHAVREFMGSEPCDAFVNVSASEGLPVTLMEAASSGIPLVATAIGGNPEIVDKSNGTLLSPNPTPEEIALALAAIQRLPAIERDAMRDASRATWESRFSADVNYGTFADLLVALWNDTT